MADKTGKVRAKDDRMLFVAGCLSACLFGLFSIALVGAISEGVKPHEVVVVSLYTGGCVSAFIGSVLLLWRGYRWAILVCIGALVAAVGGYAFEPDFQGEANYVAAMILIGAPMLMALFVGGGYVRAARRRGSTSAMPTARISD